MKSKLFDVSTSIKYAIHVFVCGCKINIKETLLYLENLHKIVVDGGPSVSTLEAYTAT